MLLYKISFPTHLTTKCYIGITAKSLKQRFKSHCGNASKSLISKAIRKYGRENAAMIIIAEYDNWESLCFAEKEAIKKYNTKVPHGYNLTDGGEGLLGYEFTDSHKAGIAKALRGRSFSSETLKKMSESGKSKLFTNEHKEKMQSARRKGINNPKYGIPRTQEVKDKISKKLTGTKLSPERIAQISIASSNQSQETRLKMSASNRNRNTTSKSGFKGVRAYGLRWQAKCTFMKKMNYLGVFDTPEEASEAYQKFVANLP